MGCGRLVGEQPVGQVEVRRVHFGVSFGGEYRSWSESFGPGPGGTVGMWGGEGSRGCWSDECETGRCQTPSATLTDPRNESGVQQVSQDFVDGGPTFAGH